MFGFLQVCNLSNYLIWLNELLLNSSLFQKIECSLAENSFLVEIKFLSFMEKSTSNQQNFFFGCFIK